jgi:hypothetical protein
MLLSLGKPGDTFEQSVLKTGSRLAFWLAWDLKDLWEVFEEWVQLRIPLLAIAVLTTEEFDGLAHILMLFPVTDLGSARSQSVILQALPWARDLRRPTRGIARQLGAVDRLPPDGSSFVAQQHFQISRACAPTGWLVSRPDDA